MHHLMMGKRREGKGREGKGVEGIVVVDFQRSIHGNISSSVPSSATAATFTSGL